MKVDGRLSDQTSGPSPMLRVQGLSKSYAQPVLRQLSFDLWSGQVVGLLEANGAGKSTLSRILAGQDRADDGVIQFDGHHCHFAGKKDAEALGIQIVQQELNLIETLSVAENLFLNRMPTFCGWINRTALHQNAAAILQTFGLNQLEPHQPVSELGVGQQQLLEVAASVSRPCRLLILDEPTAALTPTETDLLFRQLQRMKDAGTAIVFISHRLEEVRQLTDRILILRDGVLVHDGPTQQTTVTEMVQLMSGTSVTSAVSLTDDSQAAAETNDSRLADPAVLLRVRQLNCGPLVHNISLDVCRGEKVGIAGLVGSGRSEVLRAIFGADTARSGSVQTLRSGGPQRFRHPAQAVAAGIALVTEDH
ncbi:MAG: sugar ABC transporter ATP-binding protein, partial [Planctomycetaceae bacterium]|nr:sugar ABC transporter ATP-binding protein [Planctomycetaceae bacterium]